MSVAGILYLAQATASVDKKHTDAIGAGLIINVDLALLFGESIPILARPHLAVTLTLLFPMFGIEFSFPFPSPLLSPCLPSLTDNDTKQSRERSDYRNPY